jgi:GNAT superfamily N-acetyltransferase
MSNAAIIRIYRPSDRQAIRDLCCDTADLGHSVENFFSEREVFADAMMNYYTDFEPGSLWIAESEGMVVGYAAGCLNSRRYERYVAWVVMPKVFIRGILRGVLWRGETWNLVRCLIRSVRLGGFRRPDATALYPAHLHINLEEKFRGRGIGRDLVEHFFAQARGAGCAGVQVSVSEDNKGACNFFERLGFVALGRYPMARPLKEGCALSHTVIYGKKL